MDVNSSLAGADKPRGLHPEGRYEFKVHFDGAPRVAQHLTPDVLPYQIGTLAALDFLGFNGRTLTDNAPEVMF